ncbi:hypothetical protein AYX14_02263 [Cryptococcus neoformans]|nr:hypothetical protein AYX14_02263 [Cryptococcus neoformans var. grubii]
MSKNISYPIPQQEPYQSQPTVRNGNGYYNTSSGSTQRHGRQTSGSRSYPSALDSSITRLLVTTKQLLQGLDQWSHGLISEIDVSDIYVRLGNGFETCVQAFNRVGIDTRELSSIPQDLRNCLEHCLSQDPSPDSLDRFLPEIRNIIQYLLQGLKQKQMQYKRLQERNRQYESSSSLTGATLTTGDGSQASVTYSQPVGIPAQRRPSEDYPPDPRLSARSGTSSSSASPPVTSQLSQPSSAQLTTQPRSSSNPALAERERRPAPSRPPPPDAFRPARPPGPRRPSSPVGSQAPQENIHSVMGRGGDSQQSHSPSYDIPTIAIVPDSRSNSGTGPSPAAPSPPPAKPILTVNTDKPIPPRPDRFARDSYGRPISRFSVDSDASGGSPVVETGAIEVQSRAMDSVAEEGEQRSAELKRRPRTSVDRGSRASGSGSSDRSHQTQQAEYTAPSLPVLDFPRNISLHPAAPPTVRNPLPPASAHAPTLPPPESLPIPEVPPETRATLAALERSDALERRASKRFSSYTFNNLNSASSPRASPQRPTRRAVNNAREQLVSSGGTLPEGVGLGMGLHERAGSRGGSPKLERLREASEEPEESRATIEPSSPTGSVRVLKTPPLSPSATPRPPSHPTSSDPNRMNVFLQIGRKTKRHVLELPITLEALKLVFMERFEYDPGKEDFPDVYIRDRDGMEYELEGIEDLREGCTLCLNIEPLDQVKLHIDSTFAALVQEMKELRQALDKERETTKRLSILAAPSVAGDQASLSPSTSPLQPPASAISLPAPTPLVVGPSEDHLKQIQEQHEELENLRRELAITRQSHAEHISESSATISSLKDEIAQIKKVTSTNPNSNRGLVDRSKAELDTQCTETIKAVEDITDIIDAARIDAYKRFVTPSKQQMASIQSDLQKARQLVEDFTSAVKVADPTWRGTWQTELHRVMEEQKLLHHQTKLCGDLKKDLEDAESMLGNVQTFVEQRVAGTRTARIRVGADAEVEGGGISSLLMEIRTKDSDPEQRLRAIEAQQRAREKERANKVDEFEAELKGFVGGKRLKKTGGAEEVDRLRGRKDEVLRAQLTGSSGVGAITPQITGQSAKAISPQGTGASVATISGSGSAPTTPAKVEGKEKEPEEMLVKSSSAASLASSTAAAEGVSPGISSPAKGQPRAETKEETDV